MSNLYWGTDTPTEHGYYWYREPGKPVAICHLEVIDDFRWTDNTPCEYRRVVFCWGQQVYEGFNLQSDYADEMEGSAEWAGPIDDPIDYTDKAPGRVMVESVETLRAKYPEFDIRLFPLNGGYVPSIFSASHNSDRSAPQMPMYDALVWLETRLKEIES